MSNFAFSQVDPQTTGYVDKFPVPIGDYLSASVGQGWHDSAFNSVMRMTEQTLESNDPNSRMLDPDDANQLYAIRGRLSFDQPIRESEAFLLNQRKRAEMDRQFMLDQGSSALRFLPGMAASMLGGLSNPLDFALMFTPIVGEEKLAQAAATAGRGPVRQMLAGGLLTAESLERASIPYPRFLGSMIQGGVGQAIYEVPNIIASQMDRADYTPGEALINVGIGGAVAGGIHAAVTGAMRAFRGLSKETRVQMMRQAINDFIEGKEIGGVTDYVRIDPNEVRKKVLFDENQAMEDAMQSVDPKDIESFAKEKFGEKIVAAALKDPETGEVKSAYAHWAIPDAPDNAIRGYVTDKGRFIPETDQLELQAMSGIKGLKISESLDLYPESMTREERALYFEMMEGLEESDSPTAINAVRELRLKQQREAFFSLPNVQEAMKQEYERRINDVIDRKRAEFDPERKFQDVLQKDIDDQVKAGKTMPPEGIPEHHFAEIPDKSDMSKVADQIQSLREGEKPAKEPEVPVTHKAIDQAVDCLLKKIV